jgi:hypothetical protein
MSHGGYQQAGRSAETTSRLVWAFSVSAVACEAKVQAQGSAEICQNDVKLARLLHRVLAANVTICRQRLTTGRNYHSLQGGQYAPTCHPLVWSKHTHLMGFDE